MNNVIEMKHPLIQHKISRLRDKNTGTAEFRALVEEIAMLMGYEDLKDLPLEDVEVETPIEKCITPQIAGKNFAIVPILRAGLGMVSGLQALVPTAKIGHIGLYRDEETHEPHEYYCKLPNPISERLIVVTDPMLATGGSAVAAVDFIKQHGGKKIKFMAIIAAPEGVERLMEAHPDIRNKINRFRKTKKISKHTYIFRVLRYLFYLSLAEQIIWLIFYGIFLHGSKIGLISDFINLSRFSGMSGSDFSSKL